MKNVQNLFFIQIFFTNSEHLRSGFFVCNVQESYCTNSTSCTVLRMMIKIFIQKLIEYIF